MQNKSSLAHDEREFFSLVMNAVQANPFSEARQKTDLKIAGLFDDVSRPVVLDATISEVKKRIARLIQEGRADIRAYREPDKTIMTATFLFDFFHSYCDVFDQHILQQVKAYRAENWEPLPISFSGQALSDLAGKGFSRKEALHFFSLSFQLRRAFFFIDQGLVGRSPCMIQLRESLWNNVFTSDLQFYNQYLWNRMEDFSTLILGETGAGKGTAANAIGRSGYIPFDEKKKRFSESFTKSFVALNISQFPENLIESELFGHKKGSFTGAVEEHKGVFSQCCPHGSIFLDEIGEVSVPIQIKLLKVLEERQFSPVGSRDTIRFKGRIITATNRSYGDLKNPSILRKDFFYRLCSDIIAVPPLRQRLQEDPAELGDLLENRVTRIVNDAPKSLVTMLKNTIVNQLGARYPWPGNVRELEQYVRRILLSRDGNIIREAETLRPPAETVDFSRNSGGAGISEIAARMSEGRVTAQDVLKAYCFYLHETLGNFGEVARRTRLDRRTVKKYRDEWVSRMNDD